MSDSVIFGCTESGPHRAEVDLRRSTIAAVRPPVLGLLSTRMRLGFFSSLSQFRFHRTHWYFCRFSLFSLVYFFLYEFICGVGLFIIQLS